MPSLSFSKVNDYPLSPISNHVYLVKDVVGGDNSVYMVVTGDEEGIPTMYRSVRSQDIHASRVFTFTSAGQQQYFALDGNLYLEVQCNSSSGQWEYALSVIANETSTQIGYRADVINSSGTPTVSLNDQITVATNNPVPLVSSFYGAMTDSIKAKVIDYARDDFYLIDIIACNAGKVYVRTEKSNL